MLWQRLVLPDSAHICFLTIPSVPDKPAGNKDGMAIHRGIRAASAHKNDRQHSSIWIIKNWLKKLWGRDKMGSGKEMSWQRLCQVKTYDTLCSICFLMLILSFFSFFSLIWVTTTSINERLTHLRKLLCMYFIFFSPSFQWEEPNLIVYNMKKIQTLNV